MSFSLKPSDGTIIAGVHRIAGSQIGLALEDARNPALTLDVKVHAMRRRSKKVRAILKLIRPGFDDYVDENAAIRDAARRLAPARDAAVMIETFGRLSETYHDYLSTEVIRTVGDRLLARRAALSDVEVGTALSEAVFDFEALAGRIPGWEIEGDENEVTAEGMAKSLRKAAKMMAQAAETGSAEDYHEWRKWAKYHWMHVRLMKKIWPERLLDRAEALARMTRMLGAHHDLHVLCELLQEDPGVAGETADFTGHVAIAEMTRMEKEALDMGEDLLRGNARLFSARCVAYWDLALDTRFGA